MVPLIVLLVILACFLIALFIRYNKSQKEIKHCLEEQSSLKKENENLAQRNQDLAKFECCENAEKEALRIISEAKIEANKIRENAFKEAVALENDAQKILSEARLQASNISINATEEANKIREEASAKANVLTEKAKNTQEAAVRQASEIIANAEQRAKEIAGDAYNIARDAEHLQSVAKAMKNIIDGYGDEYLKPTNSALDDLAIEYGFDDAGVKLKDARELSKTLANNGSAATCEYVEKNRRDTAVAFVLDAFNGKVDSILSRIKKDNYGILEQKIKDAYAVVNNLGRAFRDARITKEYLDARLQELRWGVAVIALREKEKEEQRRIKEQIREEERAQREFEKAIREAAKEEDTIRKAMEKARAEIAKAKEEQRAKYELKLQELTIKLSEAEAKNQRALSMAQQTRSGHVYIISNIGSFGEDVFKIGMTRRLEPTDRVRELGDASVPFPFDVHAMIYSEDAPTLENELHKYFALNQMNKVNPRKEFFKVPISEIKSEIENRGLNVKWTITAEAAEYRESLAIERSIANNKESQKKWIDKQEQQIQDGILIDE